MEADWEVATSSELRAGIFESCPALAELRLSAGDVKSGPVTGRIDWLRAQALKR